MKIWRSMSLNVKLMISFFIAILLFSLFHLISCAFLYNDLVQDARDNSTERLSTAVTTLDERFSQIQSNYFALTYNNTFRQAMRAGYLSEYEMLSLFKQAPYQLEVDDSVFNFVIFFQNSDEVITSGGIYDGGTFFTDYLHNDTYNIDFWTQERNSSFSQNIYPAALFSHNSLINSSDSEMLLPVAFKPYYSNKVMVVLFLNAQVLCENIDPYLTEDFAIYDADHQLLYSSQSKIDFAQSINLTNTWDNYPDGGFIMNRQSSFGDLIYVKYLPRNSVLGQITQSIYITLLVALVVIILTCVIMVRTVIRLTHPIKDIIELLPSSENTNSGDDLNYIYANVKDVMQQQENYVRQISENDKNLSGFLLVFVNRNLGQSFIEK